MNRERQFTFIDRLCVEMDKGIRTLFANPRAHTRERPDASVVSGDLSAAERRNIAGLMRVNHCGEVCAQALYQGQALTAREASVKAAMETAADEENDHLAWCEGRLADLGSHTSWLNPAWYTGSLMLGILAGKIGDAWSLGFLAETERQVVKHLEKHLVQLPLQDHQSRLILETMRDDEAKHATTAVQAGANELPGPIKGLMRRLSRVMTTIAFWI